MNRLKVLISPLSWGFGHAGRMIPLAMALQRRGCEVVFAADAPLLKMAGKELPGITMIEIPGLQIRYSRFLPQYVCIFFQLPRVVASAVRDHRILRRLAAEIRPGIIISDNRFGFYHKDIFSVYVTHQVRIAFPRFLGWLETAAEWVHRVIINRYDLCLVPDYPGEVNLSGRLSHGGRIPTKVTYIGPLSRFSVDGIVPACLSDEDSGRNGEDDGTMTDRNREKSGGNYGNMTGATLEEFGGAGKNLTVSSLDESGSAGKNLAGASLDESGGAGKNLAGTSLDDAGRAGRNPADNSGGEDRGYENYRPDDFTSLPPKYACLILSGPEPQRTLLLEKVKCSVGDVPLAVLTATPVNKPLSSVQELYIITAPSTATMRRIISRASLVVARAGYTSVMELASLGRGAVLIPTPGQTEQEYLGRHLDGRCGFITMRQNRLWKLAELTSVMHVDCFPALPDPAQLLEKAITLLLENKK